MKLIVAAENLIERVVLALGLAPVTLVDTHMAFMRARDHGGREAGREPRRSRPSNLA